MKCEICPRNCKIDRDNLKGFCGQTNKIKISKVMFHKFEEPVISGDEKSKGSGAIFFAGCNLRCVYCQNYPISHGGKGKSVSVKGLVRIFKNLEKKGANNINLVTPTHFCEQILEAFEIYKPQIPVVWNSSGYETPQMVDKIKDIVDVHLVDLKYMDNELAKRYSKAPNYVENACESIKRMRKYQPKDIIENGLMEKGVIVRHLVLPTHTKNSIECLNFIANELGKDTIVSIMSQYEPRYDAVNYPEINRKITPLEYKRVINHAIKLGLNNSYSQDLSSADSKYTPKF